MIVAYTESPTLTTPHSNSLVLCETNFRDHQYKKEVDPDQYLQQYSAAFCISIYFIHQFLVFLIPPQNMFKMFPQISGLENFTFVKG